VRHRLLVPATLVVLVLAGAIAAAAFSVPSPAVSVNGDTISRTTVNQDLSTIDQNAAFHCYLAADVAVRSNGGASVPSLGGTGVGGTYSTQFVDYWLSQLVDDLLIEQLAARQHLAITADALVAGRSDLENTISGTLAAAATSIGQQQVCAPSGQDLLGTVPSSMLDEMVRAQTAGDLVLAKASGYGLSTPELERYFAAHPTQFQTVCLSGIQVASQATATQVRTQIEDGQSFAAAAAADSTDATSAAQGGALGCYTPTETGYQTVVADTTGLAVGQVSQPVSNNGSYLLLEVTSVQPATFASVVPAVRQAVLAAGSKKASSELSAIAKSSTVRVDPRYGRWSGGTQASIEAPRQPSPADLLGSS
jgi:parvulin-like peptidyl-prolyl isomerase